MKKVLFATVAFLCCSLSFAKTIDVENARKIAKQVLKCDYPIELSVSTNAKSRIAAFDVSEPAFYMFNNEQEEKGFVIVSADDAFPAILGYSDTGSISLDYIPEGLATYLELVSVYVDNVRAGIAVAPRKGSSTSGTPVVSPLMSSKWSQDDPYNIKCPEWATGKRCVTGCVATAMAQVVNYWKWPAQGRNSLSYTSEGDYQGVLTVNFAESVYDWDNMFDTTMKIAKSAASKEAVSKLMFDCGVASRMGYGRSSGTTLVLARIGLSKYLGYAMSKMSHEYRDCFDGTQADWNKLIFDELDNKRPIIYAAYTETGSSDAGHCFVFDGYDSNGYVHVNWGWGGTSDGYYNITLLDPDNTGSQYSGSQELLRGVQPDYDWNDEQIDQIPMYMIEQPTLNVASVGVGEEFKLTINAMYNMSGNSRTYTYGFGLFDSNGNLTDVIGKGRSQSFKYYYGIGSEEITCVIPDNYTSGKYIIRVICKESGTGTSYDWILPSTEGGTLNNTIYVNINDGTATFEQTSSVTDVVREWNADIVSTEYFTIDGRKISDNYKGVLIERQHLSDGTVKVTKVLK